MLRLKPADVSLVLSWQGRALAATPSWRNLAPMDQGLLLAFAEHVGPATFDLPGRSWAFEELDTLWLRSASAAAGGCPTTRASPSIQDGDPAAACPHRFVSVRLYPPVAELDLGSEVSCDACCTAICKDMCPENDEDELYDWRSSQTSWRDEPVFPPFLPTPVDADETRAFRTEESSLVLSFLELGQEQSVTTSATPANLQQSVDTCRDVMRCVWASLKWGGVEELPPGCRLEDLTAVLILDESRQDVLVMPPAWHECSTVSWKCPERRRRSTATRRLMYWIHALPPLSLKRSQHFLYTEEYAVGGIRRDDGVHCWGIMPFELDNEKNGYTARSHPVSLASTDTRDPNEQREDRVLRVVGQVLAKVPRSVELPHAFTPAS